MKDRDNMQEEAMALSILHTLRVRPEKSEYDLHALISEKLAESGITFTHEKILGKRCRIDFLLPSGTGIEVKRGKVDRCRLLQQINRYLMCPEVVSMIVVTESSVNLPDVIAGKSVTVLCLRRLWGIAI